MAGDEILFQNNGKAVILTRDELVDIINTAVDSAMKNYQHPCRFGMDAEDAKQIDQYFKEIKEVGDGELAKGLKVVMHNHMWLKETREKSNKIVNSFVITVTGAIALALVYTIWEGFKHKLGIGK